MDVHIMKSNKKIVKKTKCTIIISQHVYYNLRHNCDCD
jgi:hypothetical protein